MLKNECPKDLGNAVNIINKTVKKDWLYLREDDIFDFLSEEPITISIKKDENGKEEVFCRVIRIRIWGKRCRNISWNLYAKDREKLDELVIRRVIWESGKDVKKSVKSNEERQRMPLNQLSPVKIHNLYLSSFQTRSIISQINNLDSKIKRGVILNECSNTQHKKRDIEILRLYDWGQMHCKWCSDKKNRNVYRKMKKLIQEINSAIENKNEYIYKMTL